MVFPEEVPRRSAEIRRTWLDGRLIGSCVAVAVIASGCGDTPRASDDHVVLTVSESFQGSDAAEIQGRFVLQGDCTVLEDPSGETFAALFPPGTRWDASDQALLFDGGQAVSLGEQVTGSGGFYTSMEGIVSEGEQSLASQCVSNDEEFVIFTP